MPFQESDMFTRLGIGRMIKDIKREIDLKRNGMNLKLSIFSCHDSSIGSLLGAFKVFDGRWPDFGASIILEVQKDKLENEKYVRFVYQDKAMVLPQCAGHYHGKDETLCQLNKFNEICEKMVPVDYEGECSKVRRRE
ncbi:hypothetical protein O9G_000021 [Rozella allomycis CSF55]|uniref:Uncharacterized protein n=1 Tax=Rozella allomycis (strain CSF55) TaxID=988480 RepID=A0A075ANQ4_ROZAC|nr:hypothetical protein O9G_000021 [Rozella allomycis CSF55]|eukprot:EPZ31545.1 hypothetical protein O9G_000021 [Rozella allomycis CSF55]